MDTLGPAPGSGRLQLDAPILPSSAEQKGRERLKAAFCLPKPDSPTGSPWRWEAGKGRSSAQGAGAAAGREARGEGPGAPGPPSSSQAAMVPRWWPTGLAQDPDSTGRLDFGVPGDTSALSQASSFLLSRSEQHLGRHPYLSTRGGTSAQGGSQEKRRPVTQDGAEGGFAPDGWMAAVRPVCAQHRRLCASSGRERVEPSTGGPQRASSFGHATTV